MESNRSAGVFVETVRFLVTLMTTALGFNVGRQWNLWFSGASIDSDVAIITGALIGAGLGYVFGGAFGRLVRMWVERAPSSTARASAAQLFGGGFGLMVGLVTGVVTSVPLVNLLPRSIGWPMSAITVLVLGLFGARLFAARAPDIFPATAQSAVRLESTSTDIVDVYILDSSAAIDGRILELARVGLVRGRIAVPAFVVDELQGIADAQDRARRRRGRRGLDVLAALRETLNVSFEVLDDAVPEFADVDAKLLSMAARADATLVTTDHNLSRAGELRGVKVLNPHALGESLRPDIGAGDAIDVTIQKTGSEPGQGVGFLDDGTMVVVTDAAQQVGELVTVEVTNSVRTSVGRMVFARLDQ